MVGPHFISALAAPWGRVYSDSKVLQTSMMFLHFSALLFAGGFAVASDRWVLRARRAAAHEQNVVLGELARIHKPVIIGISILVVTGTAMALADADTMLTSVVFWIKMSCFGLLLLNGLLLRRAEAKLREAMAIAPHETSHAWNQMRNSAMRSVSLWVLTLLLGTMLTSS